MGGRPDFSGAWLRGGGGGATPLQTTDGMGIPWRPWSKALYDESVARENTDRPWIDNRTHCLPDGMPDVMFPPYLVRLVDAGSTFLILQEFNNQVRTVHVGGQHPSDLKPSFYGHSIGWWEGETLVVETVGINDRAPLMVTSDGGMRRTRVPKSSSLRTVERFFLIDGGERLRVELTIDDPVAFTRPWTALITYTWRPDLRPDESICADSPIDVEG